MPVTRRTFIMAGYCAAATTGFLSYRGGALGGDDACDSMGRKECGNLKDKALCLSDADSSGKIKASSGPPPTIQVPWNSRTALPASSVTELPPSREPGGGEQHREPGLR
jgi:hypothetical protein